MAVDGYQHQAAINGGACGCGFTQARKSLCLHVCYSEMARLCWWYRRTGEVRSARMADDGSRRRHFTAWHSRRVQCVCMSLRNVADGVLERRWLTAYQDERLDVKTQRCREMGKRRVSIFIYRYKQDKTKYASSKRRHAQGAWPHIITANMLDYYVKYHIPF